MMDLCVGVVTLVGGGGIDRRSIQRSTMDPSNLPRANNTFGVRRFTSGAIDQIIRRGIRGHSLANIA